MTTVKVKTQKQPGLTSRDMNVLQFIGENGLASLFQIIAGFWPESESPRTARNRLSLLEKGGYLNHAFIGARWPAELVFYLTYQAAELFDSNQQELMIVGLPSPHEQKQLLMAQDTRLYLDRYLATQNLRLIQWTNERIIRSRALSARLEGGYGWLRKGETEEGPSHMGEVPDGEILIARLDHTGSETVAGSEFRMYLEMDGQYWGNQLNQKLIFLSRLPYQTIYVVPEPRAARVRRALESFGDLEKRIIILALPWGK